MIGADTIAIELRELLDMEIADIVATANEQGLKTKEALLFSTATVLASEEALSENPTLNSW